MFLCICAQMYGCTINNAGVVGSAAVIQNAFALQLFSCSISHCSGLGAIFVDNGTLLAAHSSVRSEGHLAFSYLDI